MNEDMQIANAIHTYLKELNNPLLDIGNRIMNSFNIKYLDKIYTVKVTEIKLGTNVNITHPIG